MYTVKPRSFWCITLYASELNVEVIKACREREQSVTPEEQPFCSRFWYLI